MNTKEALKEMRKKDPSFKLLGIEDLHKRARTVIDCLPETSSWDFKSFEDLFRLLQKEEDIELKKLQIEGATDVI